MLCGFRWNSNRTIDRLVTCREVPGNPGALMEGLDYWRMCDDLSVMQCILLILGADPKRLQDIVELDASTRPEGYEAVSTAVKNAILMKKLRANVCVTAAQKGWVTQPAGQLMGGHDANGKQIFYEVEPNWNRTTIAVEDLRVWLSSRNVETGFFFAAKKAVPAVLDSKNPKYAPKLAAALEAWEAVRTDPARTRGRTTKAALEIWLNKNAARFGLIKPNGTPNNLAIEEAAKVANWDPKGGSPKTPSKPTHPPKNA